MRRKIHYAEKEFSEINITPFTDVILVLLIIFMITSPVLISGAFKIKLPTAVSSETVQSQYAEIFIDENHKIYINKQEVNLEELPIHLQIEYSKRNNKDVVVKADKNVRHGEFVKVLDAVKKTGASKLMIATSRLTEEEVKKQE